MSVTTWSIDPVHSQVEFAVKHMMFTTVRGRFADVEGTVRIDSDDPARSSAEVRIAAASIDTRAEDRDAHLRSPDFLDVEQHPELTFRSTGVSGDVAKAGDHFRVTGDLTIRGTTREVTFEGSIGGTGTDPWGATRMGASAEATIDRRDFGLTWNQALESGGILVGHDVKIELQVQAVQQQEAAVGADD